MIIEIYSQNYGRPKIVVKGEKHDSAENVVVAYFELVRVLNKRLEENIARFDNQQNSRR